MPIQTLPVQQIQRDLSHSLTQGRQILFVKDDTTLLD